MKHGIKGLTAVAALLLGVSLGGGEAVAKNTSGVAVPPAPKFDESNAKSYGKALAYYMDRYDEGWRDFYTKAKLTLTDAGGDAVKRIVVFMILEQPEGNRTLARFQAPADVRGVAALVHEHPGGTDDTWLYLPASRRTRRISGANRTASFQGTEFTYEDIARLTVENYEWKFLAKETVAGEPTFKLEARPKRSSAYSKLIVYIHRKHWRIEKIDYFDKAGRLLKTLAQEKWKLFHGRFWRPHVMTMSNHQTRKATEIAMPAMYLNLARYKRSDGSTRDNLPVDYFTKRGLENN